MTNGEEEAIRILPVHKSLIRPQLMFGADRFLVIPLLIVCVGLIFPGGLAAGNVVNIVIGVVAFLAGLRVLQVIAKYDPNVSGIFRRAMLYQGTYPAVSGFKAPQKIHKP